MQGRRGENDDVTVLGRPWTIRFRSISLKVLVWLSSNFTHNTSRGSSCAFWGIWTLTYFWFRNMTYLDVLTHTSFSGADLEKYWADYSHIAYSPCSLMSLVVPFQVFGPWPWSWSSTLPWFITSVNLTERFCGISWESLKIATPLL